MGRAVTFSTSAFNIDWDNIQQGRAVLSCGAVFSDNFGRARSRGFDAQITVSPLRGLSLNAGAAYQDATYRETIGPVSKGQRVALVPPWGLNFSADYETEVSTGVQMYARGQFDFKGSYEAPVLTAFSRVDDQNYVLARLGVRTGGVDVSAFVYNLTNSRDIISPLNFGGERVTIVTQRPRTWGLTARYNF